MQTVIDALDLSPHIKDAYSHMADVFQSHMPESLYLNYYELEEKTGIPNTEWETFLDIPEIDIYINAKIAKLIEFDAKAALNRLASDKSLVSADITALKAIIENSKLIKQSQSPQQHIVIMRY